MTTTYNKVKTYLRENIPSLIFLGLIILVSYGFELFNVHLTIDDELGALRSGTNSGFVAIGRWALCLLVNPLLPQRNIPMLPLALGLIFMLAGMFILLDCLGIKRQSERVLLIGLGLTWSGFAYILSFSDASCAIGVGFFCAALSLFIFTKAKSWYKLLAALPVSVLIGIYQPLLQPLVLVFLLNLLYHWQEQRQTIFRYFFSVLLVLGLGYLLYAGIQQFLLMVFHLETSSYISHFFSLSSILQNLGWYIHKCALLLYNLVVGDSSFYGLTVRGLPLLLVISGILILCGAFRQRESTLSFIEFSFLLMLFGIIPVIGGVLTKGYIPYRSLLGFPIFILGWVALGFKYATKPTTRTGVLVFAAFTIFQFSASINHLFSSSAFAYQEDTLLAERIIQRVDGIRADTEIPEPKYLEQIGYVDRASTPLVSRIENIGASFFGWDQGVSSDRPAALIEILGLAELEGLPDDQRGKYVSEGVNMPVWPEPGSVKVVEDVLIVKFGPYSQTQKASICQAGNLSALPSGFCP